LYVRFEEPAPLFRTRLSLHEQRILDVFQTCDEQFLSGFLGETFAAILPLVRVITVILSVV
jgi:hypothetical protein